MEVFYFVSIYVYVSCMWQAMFVLFKTSSKKVCVVYNAHLGN